MSDKPETGGECSSGKPMRSTDLDNGIDLNQPSSGEVEHDEKVDKRSDNVDEIKFGQIDSPQSDMSSEKDENMTQTEYHTSDDPLHDAIKACLNRSGKQWVYLDTTKKAIIVCFLRIPWEDEEIKQDIRRLMGDRQRPIMFYETVPPGGMTWEEYWELPLTAPEDVLQRRFPIPLPCDVCRKLGRE